MSSYLQPMVVIGVGSTGQKIVNRFRQYLYSILQGNVKNINSLIKFIILETAVATELDPDLRASQVLIPTRSDHGSKSSIEGLRKRTGCPLDFLNAIGVEGAEECNTLGGAGNVRFRGRLSLWDNWNAVKARLSLPDHSQTDFNRELDDLILPKASQADKDDIRVSGEAIHRIYIVGTLGGGTCSGSFLDIAYWAREATSRPITGIFAVPSPNWNQMDPRVKANFFGSLSEYRYFMKHPFAEIYPFGSFEFDPKNNPPFEHTFLVQWDESDDKAVDLSDQVACRLLFDFFGMEANLKDKRVDRSEARLEHDRYIHTFHIRGMNYPKYDLIVCSACELAKIKMEKMYREGEVISTRNAEKLPTNLFETTGRIWIENEIEHLFGKFFDMRLGEKSLVMEAKEVALHLPEKDSPREMIETISDNARKLFSAQFSDLVTEPKMSTSLVNLIMAQCEKLFLEWQNIRVVQYFIKGVESYLTDLRSHWEKVYAKARSEAARDRMLKRAKAAAAPSKGEEIKEHLIQDILDGLLAQTLMNAGFFDILIGFCKNRILLNRADNTFSAFFEDTLGKQTFILTSAYKKIQKVNRNGQILNKELINAEVAAYVTEVESSLRFEKNFWEQWLKQPPKQSKQDPFPEFVLETYINDIFVRSNAYKIRIQWDEIHDKLKSFDADINEKRTMFSADAKIKQGLDGHRGVPKYLLSPTDFILPDDLHIEFGKAAGDDNGQKHFPLLEDFLVFYMERTEFRLEELRFWEESRKAYQDYPRKKECQTVPFDDPSEMERYLEIVRNKIEMRKLGRDRGKWVDALVRFCEDFIFDWNPNTGDLTGVNPDIIRESSLDIDQKPHGADLQYSLRWKNSHKNMPSEIIELWPKNRLRDYLLKDDDLFMELMEQLDRFAGQMGREALINRFETIRESYEPRRLGIEEGKRRMEIYFGTADKGPISVLDFIKKSRNFRRMIHNA